MNDSEPNDYGQVADDERKALDRVFEDLASNGLPGDGWTRQEDATDDGDKFMFLHASLGGVLEVKRDGPMGEDWFWGHVTDGLEYDTEGWISVEGEEL